MKKLILLLFLLKTFSVVGQNILLPEWKKYSWDEDRKPYALTADEKKKGAVIIKDRRIVEIYFDGEGKTQEVNEYTTKHVIISLNSDNAIEEYNTVYIPMTGVTEVVDLQARFISKTGKIVNFDKKSVKDVENYDNHGPYKIFALEGIEKGGEVEYIYTVKKPYRLFGTETYRSSYDYREITLDIFAPSHLKFDAKSYNGLPDPKEDEDHVKKNVLHMEADSVAGFEDEIYSSGDGAYPRVEYKLAYNTAADPRKRLYTWNDAADGYYKAVADASENEKRMCEALYKRMGVEALDGNAEKIKKIESFLKTHFTVREDASGEKFERITGILQSHLATEFGIMRLYWAIFDVAGIKKEMVLTSDRFDKQFDGDFDSWTYLQHFLMYFPSTKSFIAPTEQFSRYGFVTAEWASQDGLFIREVELGGVKSAIGSVKHINPTDWQVSINGLYANIDFNLESGISNLHMKQTYTGYAASFIQPYFPFLSKEDRRNYTNDLLKNLATDAKPKNTRVSGYNSDDTLYYKPFSVEADYSTNAFLEKTCDKYIFKVGEVIGAQVEMYQSQARRTDMELPYAHGFHREIRFTIPDGYRCTNLDALNMDVHHEEKSDEDTSHVRTMDFVSSYKVEGKMVTVIADESYRVTHYPKAIYEDYRKVINASADFNKIVVYFEKNVQ
jgi:hypothetical protein